MSEIRAPRGTTLTARSWQTEAPMRMLMNNLDPEVAEHPEQLIVYGGTGKAARDWPSYQAIVRTLTDLRDDETLLVQSGRPVGVMRTHEWAPRVLIANSNLVGDWATWEEFRRLEAAGLTMYGQMTAGSWIYIGTQGILQGTYETFGAVAAKSFGGTLAGTITLTAGLGGMGGAQPLAVTMNDGVCVCVEVDQSRITRRIEHRYLDVQADDLAHAMRLAEDAKAQRKPLSIGVLGNAADVVPELLAAGAPIDIVTDQTSAHDPLYYLPHDVVFDDWAAEREKDPAGFTERARASMARHCEAMVGFADAGAEVFDYGNSLRAEAREGGFARAFDYPGFVPAYIRPLFCEGKGPFRWAALSGDPADIRATDEAVLELFPDNDHLHRWIRTAQERVALPGTPGAHLLARLRRAREGRHAVQRHGRERRAVGAGRHRSRSPRLRLGRVPVPRDRGHARRLGRHRRLAAAQRDGQRGVRRHLGVDPPRWRRRHRPLHPRRPGLRRRRHAARGPEGRARAHQRPGHGRHPARRRRLRRGRRRRRRARRARADAGPSRPHGFAAGGTPAQDRADAGRHREGRPRRRDRRLPPVRVDRRGHGAPRVVRRRGRGPRHGRRRGRQRQPAGLDQARSRCAAARLAPRLGAGRRSLRRPARRGVRLRRARPHSHARAADRRRELRRRGGRPVRHRLRRVAAGHRSARAREGARAQGPRRPDLGRGPRATGPRPARRRTVRTG